MAGLLALILLPALGAVSISAAPSTGEWHRNNYGAEHERLTCREGALVWTCSYDKVPESLPGFSWNAATGRFAGRNVTSSWSCPTWFPATICDNVTLVYQGMASYVHLDGRPDATTQDYVVTNLNGQAILYQYFSEYGFACPWYRTFDEALGADFNCVFAP